LRALVLGLAVLLGACATQAPDIGEPLPQPHPAPAPLPSATAKPLEAAKLPPFQGPRHEVKDPLRRVVRVDRTVAPTDVWQRIRQGFAMPDLKTALVRAKTREYAANRASLQKMLERARPYLFHIVEEIEKRGLPTELALLPIIESRFDPMAYSRARASGLWQFIPSTGRRYDLTQNWWYDGRRDIIDSTEAALDYLAKVYAMHRDWHLALASYNWGEGAVMRAKAKNRAAGKKTDYASLRMPRETAHYVPKLQALKNIIADPARYGIDLDPLPNEPYFALVTATPDIDVQLAAELAEMPVAEFMALNPGFSRPVIRAEMASRIVLPWDRVVAFHDNLAKHHNASGGGSLVSWEVYKPRPGDTLGSVAKRFGLTIAELKRVNNIPQRSWTMPKLLVVPADGAPKDSFAKLPVMHAPSVPERSPRGVHVVKRGDTLSSIAARYGVKVQDLQRWNRVTGPLQIGRKLVVRKPVT
jgi:membrane-bound lytic murein transglycosylase D